MSHFEPARGASDPLSGPPFQQSPVPPSSRGGGSATGCLWIVGLLVGGFIAAVVIGGVSNSFTNAQQRQNTNTEAPDRPASSATANQAAVPSEAEQAATACEKAVLKRLKAPATAQFTTDPAVGPELGPWSVTGNVDSDNSYGAFIRTPFQCAVTLGDNMFSTTIVHINFKAVS